MDDWTTAPVDDRLRAGLRLAEAMTKHPQDIDAAFVAELRAAGLDDEAIEDAANVTFHFNFINRLTDAFDLPRLDEGPRRKLARYLDRAGRIAGGPRPEPSWMRGADGLVRPVEVELARALALEVEAELAPELRRAIEARAASWFAGVRPEPAELPELVGRYVDKVARWAYKVIDEDFDELKAAGWGEEAIFELTYVAALGASCPALERLFAALYAPASSERAPARASREVA